MKEDPNYPEAYNKGYIYFCERQFKVTQDVLIPRIETEQIIDFVSNFIATKNLTTGDLCIYDIGTGSGCLAVTLALMFPRSKITAIDVSEKALDIAKLNAATHRVTSQLTFVSNNLLKDIHTPIDIIVSNLPYIPTSRIKTLDSSVKDFEPNLALDGGTDGFVLYRHLLKQISNLPKIPSYMIFEIDEEQGEIAIFEANKNFTNKKIEIKKDKFGYDRFLEIC